MLLGIYPWYYLLQGRGALIIGHLTGIIANAQSVIFVPEANKTTQFIKLCNSSNTPIIYLHNVTGFMVGAKTESQGLIKAGAQLVNAVSNSKVRKVLRWH
jgi:acetyl-CoA carboxylase carboxyltransferase component